MRTFKLSFSESIRGFESQGGETKTCKRLGCHFSLQHLLLTTLRLLLLRNCGVKNLKGGSLWPLLCLALLFVAVW